MIHVFFKIDVIYVCMYIVYIELCLYSLYILDFLTRIFLYLHTHEKHVINISVAPPPVSAVIIGGLLPT